MALYKLRNPIQLDNGKWIHSGWHGDKMLGAEVFIDDENDHCEIATKVRAQAAKEHAEDLAKAEKVAKKKAQA